MTPPAPQREHREDGRCHADNDGDCDWEACPHKVDYQPGCPLFDWDDDDRRW